MADGTIPQPESSSLTTSEPLIQRPYKFDWVGLVPFILCHLVPFAAIWSGVTWQSVVVCIALYWIRMFGVTGGYHRYFAHRTYKTSRFFQFCLAFIAATSAQKGAIWWAAHHRRHHLYSDQPEDIHSPKQDGFVHSHVGWMFVDGSEKTDWKRIKDFTKYPELVFLNRFQLLPAFVLGFATFFIWGWSGLFIGFFLSTCLLWHGTFTINSLCHVWGKRRFVTKDTSRNNLWLALITMGEGWHNNHHHYMRSTRQGFYWWEIDLTYYVLRALAAVGIVWDIQEPPAKLLELGRKLDAAQKQPVSEPVPALARVSDEAA